MNTQRKIVMAQRVLCIAIIVMAVRVGIASGGQFVPFVIPADWPEDAEINFSSPPVNVDSPRIVARNGHFYRPQGDGKVKRIRIWGVNLCFGACFPKHKDAKRVAARLAAFGINSVRFHHMDTALYPRGIWDAKNPTRFSSEALDRLDYFIDQLARKGIVANINLHVGRGHSRYLKLPDPGRALHFDKIVSLFTPALIAAQQRYARDLLGHTNKYRKVRYADDPAVAFVEITNENSFFMWGGPDKVRNLPDFYAQTLRKSYAAWIKARYGSTVNLRAAWSKGAESLGKNTLPPLRLKPTANDRRVWRVEQHGNCRAAAALLGRTPGVRIEITKADSTSWHIQFNTGGLKLDKNRYYTLTFRARADKPRDIRVGVSQAHEPWGPLGLSRTVKLDTKWKPFRAGFLASASDNNARVSFLLGGSDVDVALSNVRLQPGGRQGLLDNESVEKGNIALFVEGETPERMLDRMRFLAACERGYFAAMRKFVKQTLGCGALVTGTIVFGPLGLWAQSDMDFIDSHAYWHHPHFPGRPWDPGNWTVQQKAMADSPAGGTLFRLAACRLEGKPFTVSEYNHPAPNDFQAECIPMLATFAAIQDWDGLWLFAYSHKSDNWDAKHFSSFFDMHANPAKWGFVPAGTAIFREGGLAPAAGRITVTLRTRRQGFGKLADLYVNHGRDMFAAARALAKVQPKDLLTRRIFMSMGRAAIPLPDLSGSETKPQLTWKQHADRKGLFVANGPGACVTVGTSPGGDAFKHPHTDTVTVLDGRPLTRSDKILITLCGRCENTDMRFSRDRRTVGRNWGKPPVRIEALDFRVSLPKDWAERFDCFALRPDGKRGAKVPIQTANTPFPYLDLHPKYATMWYLLTRKKK